MKCEQIKKMVLIGEQTSQRHNRRKVRVVVEVLESRVDHFDDCPEDEVTAFDMLVGDFNVRCEGICPSGYVDGGARYSAFWEGEHFDDLECVGDFAEQIFKQALTCAKFYEYKYGDIQFDKITKVEMK